MPGDVRGLIDRMGGLLLRFFSVRPSTLFRFTVSFTICGSRLFHLITLEGFILEILTSITSICETNGKTNRSPTFSLPPELPEYVLLGGPNAPVRHGSLMVECGVCVSVGCEDCYGACKIRCSDRRGDEGDSLSTQLLDLNCHTEPFMPSFNLIHCAPTRVWLERVCYPPC